MVSEAFWRDRRVLVTGHAGFKGSWLCAWLARLGAEVTGVGLGPEDGSPTLFALAGLDARVAGTAEVDVRDAPALARAVAAARPEVVFHLAGQALVRPGLRDPLGTMAANVMGTANLLEAARAAGSVRSVVLATSDKCYRESGLVCDEDSPLGGHEPYGASKACAELVAAAWRSAYLEGEGIGLATVRAGNVIGGGDAAEDRLIPDLVRAYVDGRPTYLRQPEAVRPWQHVLDALGGYLTLAERLHSDPAAFAGPWNIGPDLRATVTVREVAAAFTAALGGTVEDAAEPARHETHVLRLSAAKARRRLGWRPRLALEETVRWTADAYRRLVTEGDTSWLMEQVDRYALRLVEPPSAEAPAAVRVQARMLAYARA